MEHYTFVFFNNWADNSWFSMPLTEFKTVCLFRPTAETQARAAETLHIYSYISTSYGPRPLLKSHTSLLTFEMFSWMQKYM
jgi:hypothetical protein